jgi:phasin family protein
MALYCSAASIQQEANMASKGRKPGTTAKAPAATPKPAAKPPVAVAAAKPVVKPPVVAAAPKAAVAAPVKPAPVAIKPVEAAVEMAPIAPVVPKIELPVPAPVTPEPVIEMAAEPAGSPEPVVPEPVIPEPALVVETPTPVAAATVATIQKEVTIMEANLKNAAEKAQTYFVEANERAKAAVEKGTKLFEEANEFSKGNVEAIVESGKIAAKGIETLGQEAADYSRKQFEGATAALKSLSSVKSPTDFFKLHSDYVRSAFDSIVAQTSKNTEAMLKLAGEVAQPISNRVAVAVEKAKIAA